MTERTLITEADFSVKALNSIKRTFPNAVTLGELRQAISDDPKTVDYLGGNTYKEIEIVLGGISGNDTAVVSSAAKCGLMTETAKHAYTVHAQIILGAQMVEDGLYQMAKGFKIMRDEKLYKELGYKSFEEYCETETGIKRRQVYSYIAIAEKLPADFVHSGAQIGVKKLALLTALDEEQRTEIVESTDLESTTVRELRAKIDVLTGKNKTLTTDVEKLTKEKEQLEGETVELELELQDARRQPKDAVFTPEDVFDPTQSDAYKELEDKYQTLELAYRNMTLANMSEEEFRRRVVTANVEEHNRTEAALREQQKHSDALLRMRTEGMQEHIDKLEEQLRLNKVGKRHIITMEDDKWQTFLNNFLTAPKFSMWHSYFENAIDIEL